MNQKILQILKRSVSYILVAALASGLTWVLAAQVPDTKLEQLSDIIERQFIGQADQTQIEDAAASAMVQALGDRWSHYISAQAYASHLERQNNAYVGVGITIQQRQDGQGFDIIAVNEEGPAAEAGILAGDLLTHAAGEPVGQMDADQLRAVIMGQEDSKVILTVVRGEETLEFAVTRRTIRSKVASGQLLDGNVGLITIENFYENAGEESIAQVEAMLEQGAEKLIFDVRNNPGGYVSEMIEILDYLLPEGTLFRSESYDGTTREDTSDAACLELPMAVLFNENSYSAAELFAAALWEYEWAVTVGQPTCGKAHYQYTIPLMDGSAVALSVGRYTTPKGVNLTQTGGLQPDIPVEVGTGEEDPQLLAAVEALTKETP